MKTIYLGLLLLLATTQSCMSQTEKKSVHQAKVTFIELGSVRCIPCRKMEAVLESIRKKYPKDVKVIFYDVWTKEGRPYAEKYHVNRIPTQVFLDANGKEFYRHVGYFPEAELIKILKQKKVRE